MSVVSDKLNYVHSSFTQTYDKYVDVLFLVFLNKYRWDIRQKRVKTVRITLGGFFMKGFRNNGKIWGEKKQFLCLLFCRKKSFFTGYPLKGNTGVTLYGVGNRFMIKDFREGLTDGSRLSVNDEDSSLVARLDGVWHSFISLETCGHFTSAQPRRISKNSRNAIWTRVGKKVKQRRERG